MNAKTAAVCSLFAAAVLAACSPAEQKTAAGSGASAPAAAAVKKVAITAIADHPALDTIRAGVIDGLKAEGFEEGKNLVIDFQSAQGSTANAAQIAKKFAGDQPDAIVAITTPSAQAAAAATKTVPVVYTAVTDPVGAKLVGSFAPSGSNIVGVSDELPVGPQIGLMKKLVPNLKTIGYVYSPGEVNSVTVLNRLKEKAAEQGLQVAEAPAARSADVLTAARSLAGRADVIFTSLDNNVVAAYESMYKAASESKIPLVASDADSVTRGAVAAMGMDSFGTGQKAGRMTAAILKGAKPGDMPSEKLDRLELYLSKKHAAALGIALPPELLSEAKEIKE
ncbi:ABC transporter substrate-binding protein [Neisseria bacilliformis]|uniref:ABC transporter substrate-binding protein n=1 Tax=Neisseria bacilliformis TaxID=267212 RepID=UPI0028F12CC0|nr:ABC transporter substrate-binding protein [Neisseria bacilliformis]